MLFIRVWLSALRGRIAPPAISFCMSSKSRFSTTRSMIDQVILVDVSHLQFGDFQSSAGFPGSNTRVRQSRSLIYLYSSSGIIITLTCVWEGVNHDL